MPLASRCRPGHFARFDRTEICWPIFSTGRVTTNGPLLRTRHFNFGGGISSVTADRWRMRHNRRNWLAD